MNLDWLVVGGGIHGVHLAARLLEDGPVAPEQLAIVDPAETLLARWKKHTKTTGMRYLRSPAVHHLAIDPWSLQRFAGKGKNRKKSLFAPPYDRPALSLFNTHCDQLIESLSLSQRHIQAKVTRCVIEGDGVKVSLSTGAEISAKQILLAIGISDQPVWPDWAPRADQRVHHIFAPGFDGLPTSKERVAVLGGGISAGQVALRLAKEGHQVHLISRHDLRQHQFDSDPGWIGPKLMSGFLREPELDRRRALIQSARHRGSVPPDVLRRLRRAISDHRIHWHQAEVTSMNAERDALELQLSTESVTIDRLLLATGFSGRRPGGEMIDELISSAALPCSQCGYPMIDVGLRWHPRVYVTGPLAELELGPTARNITGARRAGDRIMKSIHAERSQSKQAKKQAS